MFTFNDDSVIYTCCGVGGVTKSTHSEIQDDIITTWDEYIGSCKHCNNIKKLKTNWRIKDYKKCES